MDNDRYNNLIRMSMLLLLTTVGLVGLILLRNSSRQTTIDTPVADGDQQVVVCGAVDVNGDGKLTLLDFANFAKLYNKVCIQKIETADLTTPEGDLVIDYTLRAKDVVEGSNALNLDLRVENATIESFKINNDAGWIAPIGTCNANAETFTQTRVCVGLAKVEEIKEGDEIGTLTLKYEVGEEPVLFTTSTNTYSDGQEEFQVSGTVDSFGSEAKNQAIEFDYIVRTTNSNQSLNAYNADIKITNGEVVSFTADSGWLQTLGSCENNNPGKLFTSDRICLSVAKQGTILEGTILGVAKIKFTSPQNIVIEATGENVYTDGTTEERFFGVLDVFTPAEITLTCGNVDANGDNKIDIVDFASFAQRWGEHRTCIID